uniref:ATP synthase F0 subunit 8 n=1 Tax=Bullacta caurina TaxID=2510888 RepID=A0A4D6BMW7_9GAST|nr:ATP synthase F0 subunit 8 [Bullacta caurina]QBX88147.1 ATP synthase F0 subunit 8 [Bullacta caurina]
MPQLSPTMGILFFSFIFIAILVLMLNLSSSPKKINL